MNINKWTIALAAAGVVSLASVTNAQEAKETVKTLAASTTLSGYVSTSVNWSPGSTGGFRDQSYTFNSGKNDRVALDVVSLTFASKAGEGEWAAGYKAQIWAGPDAATLGTADSGADFAIKNAYVSLRTPLGSGVDLKLGVFDPITGYESTDRNVNPFYSHSWSLIMQPRAYTGLLASYRISDAISLSAGIANTRGNTINGAPENNSRKTYTAAVALVAPDSFGFLKGASVTGGWLSGRLDGGGASTSLDYIYVGGTIPLPIKDLSLGVAWDDLYYDGGSDTSVVAGYLSYKVNDKLTANTRVEYLDVGAVVFGSTGVGGVPIGSELLSATIGLDYKLWANVTSRVEYRLDSSMDSEINGRKHNQSVTANVIYNF